MLFKAQESDPFFAFFQRREGFGCERGDLTEDILGCFGLGLCLWRFG
jgi:hypothetical protein